MAENEQLSPGGKANLRFIDNMRAVQPLEVQDLVPTSCLDCSTAWLHAVRDRGEARLQACTGRAEVEIGGVAIMLCHIPGSAE